MNYRLGNLLLRPDLGDEIRAFAAGLRRPRGAAPDVSRHHRELVRLVEGIGRDSRAAPDLLAELRDDPGPDAWVFELAAVLAAHRGLLLTHCERETGAGGYLAIAVHDPAHAAAVRAGDLLCAGLAAVRGPDGTVEVLPRVYRKICENGAVVFAHAGADLLHEAGSVREAVRTCLAPATAGAAFALLQAAARTPAPDPIALLRRAHVPVAAEEVWASREDDDASVFGVVNALTARARREPRFDRRLAIERGAARILAGVPVGALRRPEALLTSR